MVKYVNKVIKTKNTMKTTLFSTLTTEQLYTMLFAGKITYNKAMDTVNVIQTGRLTDDNAVLTAFRTAFDNMDTNMNTIGNYLGDLVKGRYQTPVNLLNTNNLFQGVNAPKTIYRYDTEILKHVLSLGKTPNIKKIKFKFQLFNPVVALKVKIGDEADRLKSLLFINQVVDYCKYMTILGDQMKHNYWEPEVVLPVSIQIPQTARDSDGGIIYNQSTQPAVDIQLPSVQHNRYIIDDGNTNGPSYTLDGARLTNVGLKATHNYSILDILVSKRSKNYQLFKDELNSMYKGSVEFFDSNVNISLRSSKKYYYILFPLVDPRSHVPNITIGRKYLTTVVTYDRIGVEAELSSYGKQVLQNAYVVLKKTGGKIKRKRLRIRKSRKSRRTKKISKKVKSLPIKVKKDKTKMK